MYSVKISIYFSSVNRFEIKKFIKINVVKHKLAKSAVENAV